MKFRITIEQYIHPNKDEVSEYGEVEPHWDVIKKEEITIGVAERASRMIEKLIQDEGLDINRNDLRKILFEELHEGRNEES